MSELKYCCLHSKSLFIFSDVSEETGDGHGNAKQTQAEVLGDDQVVREIS